MAARASGKPLATGIMVMQAAVSRRPLRSKLPTSEQAATVALIWELIVSKLAIVASYRQHRPTCQLTSFPHTLAAIKGASNRLVR